MNGAAGFHLSQEAARSMTNEQALLPSTASARQFSGLKHPDALALLLIWGGALIALQSLVSLRALVSAYSVRLILLPLASETLLALCALCDFSAILSDDLGAPAVRRRWKDARFESAYAPFAIGTTPFFFILTGIALRTYDEAKSPHIDWVAVAMAVAACCIGLACRAWGLRRYSLAAAYKRESVQAALGGVPNEAMVVSGRQAVFSLSPAERRRIALRCLLGALVFLGFPVADDVASKPHPHFHPHAHTVGWGLFVSLFVLGFTLYYAWFLARKELARRFTVDLVTRTYSLTSADRKGWRDWSPNDQVPRLLARTIQGDLSRDLAGVGILSWPKSGVSVVYRYRVVAVWRDAKHPPAILSERYFNEQDAETVQKTIAALLGTDALGLQ